MSNDKESRWQFWIDVGGTFTDCLACSPDEHVARYKVLSSAVTKGQLRSFSSPDSFVDSSRTSDPPIFWNGYRWRLLDRQGQTIAESHVAAFDHRAGVFRLAAPVESELLRSSDNGWVYELDTDEGAPLLAIRRALQLPLCEPIPPVVVRLGTTRGTNALLTRRGARTAFVTTRGFGDVLRIGYQNRPRLFELKIRKPSPLYEAVAEINERTAADGAVLQPLDEEQARSELLRLRQAGIESLAICLLNSYQNPGHEERLEQLAGELGFAEISRSSRVAPLRKIVSRGDTTVVDAYLTPVLRTYVARLRESLGHGSSLHLLTSAGGLVEAERFHGKDSVLSGPAGGVVGFSRVA
ncbi:MAG: hydantoinase, partial [Planctomycetales bacterium]|nr:hydantoinase [Planctomycetales bacterium]